MTDTHLETSRPPDRREFLSSVTRCAGGLCLAGSLGGVMSNARAEDAPQAAPPKQALTREVDFYEKLSEQRVQCFVCPFQCVLKEGDRGVCRSRENQGGKLINRGYAKPCILRVDPIEKVPLNHFRPATQTVSIAIGGCNLRCKYCQNWQQSQKAPDNQRALDLPVDEAIAAAKRKGIDTIALTYTEPIAFLEYATDIAKAAQAAKLRVVIATAAYVNPKPWLRLAKHVDAFAISLKGFDETFYQNTCEAELQPVLDSIKTLKKKTNCWLELVNLIVPTYNDDTASLKKMCQWVRKTVGGNVPLHFSRFVPTFNLSNLPRTSVQTLEAACKIGQDAGLRYVYTSNIAPHNGTNTVCAKCHHPLIYRLGFKILENKQKKGVCPNCKTKLPGVWE